MNHLVRFLVLPLLLITPVCAQVPASPGDVQGALAPLPDDPSLARFKLLAVPAPGGLLLREGDRLAIIGDSITEQKMYSRIIETYLTVSMPHLKVAVRQFGWSGETAEGFLRRVKNDCLRFEPTVATLCYGMNDHRYRTYDPANGQWYRDNYGGVVAALKGASARVVLGSPGNVGKVPGWTKSGAYTLDDLNLNLATLRNIGVGLAAAEGVAFADVFGPMLRATVEAWRRFGPDYHVPGKDGVHPDWAGHLIMAHAFLKAMGLDGNLGTITVDLATGRAGAENGHEVTAFEKGLVSIRSTRYPFCAGGEPDKDNSIRSGMALVPFNQELNRLTLIVRSGKAPGYRVTWGEHSRTYSSAQLGDGVNLAADFVINPFTESFRKVDEAVAKKQAYETRQVKMLFHGEEGRADMEATVALTEKARQPLVDAIALAMAPVKHQLRIEPVD